MTSADTVSELRGGGFSEPEVADTIAEDVQKLRGAGFSEKQIQDHYGIPAVIPFDTKMISESVRKSMQEVAGDEDSDLTFVQAIEAGFQQSITGLLKRQKVPDIIVPENASTADRITSQVAQVIGDIPAFGAGFFAAAPAGGGVGSAITGTAGAFALPAAMRELLMQTYENGQIQTPQEFWDVLSAVMIEEFKGLATGAAVGTASAGVAGAVKLTNAVTAASGKQVIPPLAATVTSRAAEITAMTTVGAAVEGHIPRWRDVTDAAAVISVLSGAVGGARFVSKNTKAVADTYRNAGRRPDQVLEDMELNPTIRDDMGSTNHSELPRAYKEVRPATKEEVVGDIGTKIEPEVMQNTRGDAVGGLTQAPKIQKVKTKTGEEFLITEGDVDSLNFQVWYHGGKKGITRPDSNESLVSGLFGPGFYMTDNPGVANSYKAGRRNGATYEVGVQIRRALDFDKPLPKAAAEAMRNEVWPEFLEPVEAAIAKGKTGAEVWSKMTEEMREHDVTTNEVVDMFQGIEAAFREAGFDAITHVGGDRAGKGKLAHRVLILIDPADNFRPPAEIEPKATVLSIRELPDATKPPAVPPPPEPPAAAVVAKSVAPPTTQPLPPAETPGGVKPPSALDQVKERISFDEKQQRRTPRQFLDSLYADWVRKQHPLGKFVKEVAKGAELSILEDPAKLAQLEAGVTARAGHFLEHSPLDFKTFERIGKPLREILEPVKSEMDDFSAYLVAKRTLEVGETTKRVEVSPGDFETVTTSKTGVDRDVARRAVAEGNAKGYGQAATELVEFQGHVLAYLRDAGVISKESHDFMREAGKDYVPLYRSFADDAVPISGKGGGRQARNPIFRFRGSDRSIVNPVESVLKNTYMFIAIAERNQIGLQLTKLAAKHGRDDIARKIKEKSRPVTVQPEELKRAATKWQKGEDLTAAESAVLEAFAESEFTIFRPNGLRPKENQILVFEKGEKSLWQIDPEVYRTFASGSPETNGLIMKVLTAPARLVRAGAVLSPEFIVRNPARDAFTAFAFSENKGRFIVDAVHGFGSVWNRDAAFQDWVAGGGAQAALVSLERTYLQKQIGEIISKGGLQTAARNILTKPIEILRLSAELTESATRVGEFKRARKGKPRTKESLLQAGLDSRNVTLDFAQMGTQARAVNMIVPFFSAKINGIDRAIRAFKDNPARTSAKVAATITIPSILLHMNNHDKQWYKDVPRWQKDLFWLVRVGEDKFDSKGRLVSAATIWRIPKPFELGIIFGTGVERMMDSVLDDDPDAFSEWYGTALAGASPGYMPSGPSPIIETFANRKIFFDTPIVPGYLEGQLPEYQYKTYTTELSKAVGRTLATIPGLKHSKIVSPLVLENLVSSWTGGVGRHVLNLLDAGLRKAGALPDPIKPAWQLADIPVIKAFIVRNPTMGTAAIQEFFERAEKNERVLKTVTRLQLESDFESAARELEIAGRSGLVPLDNIRETITGYSRAIRMISNPKLPFGSPEERRQTIDNFYWQANRLAIQGLRMIDQIEGKEVKQ